jgi:hypothetical protein
MSDIIDNEIAAITKRMGAVNDAYDRARLHDPGHPDTERLRRLIADDKRRVVDLIEQRARTRSADETNTKNNAVFFRNMRRTRRQQLMTDPTGTQGTVPRPPSIDVDLAMDGGPSLVERMDALSKASRRPRNFSTWLKYPGVSAAKPSASASLCAASIFALRRVSSTLAWPAVVIANARAWSGWSRSHCCVGCVPIVLAAAPAAAMNRKSISCGGASQYRRGMRA